MHNSRNKSKVKTLRECLLKVKGIKLQRKNDTRLSNDENQDEGLYTSGNERLVTKKMTKICISMTTFGLTIAGG